MSHHIVHHVVVCFAVFCIDHGFNRDMQFTWCAVWIVPIQYPSCIDITIASYDWRRIKLDENVKAKNPLYPGEKISLLMLASSLLWEAKQLVTSMQSCQPVWIFLISYGNSMEIQEYEFLFENPNFQTTRNRSFKLGMTRPKYFSQYTFFGYSLKWSQCFPD